MVGKHCFILFPGFAVRRRRLRGFAPVFAARFRHGFRKEGSPYSGKVIKMTYSEAKAKLEKYEQEQLLRYYDELSDSEKQALLDQIDSADMSVVSY